MSLTRYVAEFATSVTLADIPADVLHLGKRSILDGLGLALAGSRSHASEILRGHVGDLGGHAEATVIGTDRRAPTRFAAFLNGVSIHADDYDDTQLATAPDRVYGLLTHPTAPVLPAALAIAERRGLSGADLLLAYQIGVEVECKIAEAIFPRHYQDGFHSTGTMGALGAAMACIRLLGGDADAACTALGIAASESSGLRENFGTMMKPFHAGRAAENGAVAADLAMRGLTATPIVLEAGRGFFKAAAGGYEADLIDGKLGNPWNFADPGVSIKPHPSGSLTHPGMGLMLDMIREHDIRPEQVSSVSVGTNQNMPNALIHHRPTTELQAKFSMEFCMAILLLERRAGLAEFTDEVVNRPDVKAMIEKIEFGIHPDAEAAGYDKMRTIIDINLADGQVISGYADFGKGSPTNPMSDDELVEKYMGCADWARAPEATARETVDQVMSLERLGTVPDLALLRRS
ncbi:MAG TPA: MmgE/PrpD family protein [Chloroflexota bacterium]|nr:MmgE/PrpD family protein [Chloroflexota bacterium]